MLSFFLLSSVQYMCCSIRCRLYIVYEILYINMVFSNSSFLTWHDLLWLVAVDASPMCLKNLHFSHTFFVYSVFLFNKTIYELYVPCLSSKNTLHGCLFFFFFVFSLSKHFVFLRLFRRKLCRRICWCIETPQRFNWILLVSTCLWSSYGEYFNSIRKRKKVNTKKKKKKKNILDKKLFKVNLRMNIYVTQAKHICFSSCIHLCVCLSNADPRKNRLEWLIIYCLTNSMCERYENAAKVEV